MKHKKHWLLAVGLVVISAIILGVLIIATKDKNLVVTRAAISNDVSGNQIISGTVENKTVDKVYSQVQVSLEYLNTSGQVVGQEVLKTKALGPHMVWGFKTNLPTGDITRFKIKASSAHIFGLRW